MGKSPKQVISGTIVKFKPPFRMEQTCCDCGLVHTVIYTIKNKHILMEVFRNDAKTKEYREEKTRKTKRRNR